MESEPTCRALCCRGAVCLSGVRTYLRGIVLQWCSLFKWSQNLPAVHCVTEVQAVSGVRTYLPGTVLQRCRLFKWSQNLPARHCVAGVQSVKVESEPTCRALCCRGAGCVSGVRTYLPGIVLQGCSLFKWSQNLPAGHCVAEVQAV